MAAIIVLAALLLVSARARAAELVINGGFETGDFGAAWVHGAYRGGNYNLDLADHIVLSDFPHSGNYAALLGFKYTRQTGRTHAFLYQDVSIPTNISMATLYFKIRQQGYDSFEYDPFIVDIRGTDDTVFERVITQSFPESNHLFKDSGWLSDDENPPEGFDVSGYAGQTIRLYFEQSNQRDVLYATWTYIDDVSLIYKKFVDLIVDGEGQDVFGDPGTGLGGLSARSGIAGDTLVYVLEVENEGLDADSYLLSVSAPPGWVVWLENGGGPQVFPYTTGTISPSSTNVYTIYVLPPAGETSGSYNIVLDAVSTSQGNRFDGVTIRSIVVDAIHGVDLAVDGNGYGAVGENGSGGFASKEAPSDSMISFSLDLINTGNAPSSFLISYDADPASVASIWYNGTEYTGPFTTSVVPDGSSLSMMLNVMVPGSVPGGDYVTIVTAAATLDTLKKDSIKAVLRHRAPRIDMIILASGDGIYDDTFSGLGGSGTIAGGRGTTVVFPLLLQNEGFMPDSFVLTWDPPGSGWTAFLADGGVDNPFPCSTETVLAYGQKSYQLKVLIPGGASYGPYASYLHAVSNTDNNISESVTAAVSVSESGEIDMLIDGSGFQVYGPVGTGLGGSSVRTVSPGDSVVFMVEIQNISGTNSFDISWNTPSGWQVTFDGQSSPVTGYPAGLYELKAFVPATSPGGTFDIVVDGHKTDKPFLVDSVLGRLIVTLPAAVDAVIDGNGDGVYGALGSGLGGTSTQTTSSPAILNYTVELQNEGEDADQFTLTWNAVPLWNATLEGAASPYTTGVIPSGGSVFLTFSVTVPANETTGDYQYIMDVVSSRDSTAVESIEAKVTIVSPPRVDLVIDGNGAGVFGLAGTGEGGVSLRVATPGSFYSAALEVRNAGSYPDSFYIDWEPPLDWPAGSIAVNDGSVDHSAPFWTQVILPAEQLDFTIKVQVPGGLAPGGYAALINSWSSLPPNLSESVKLVTQTGAVLTGIVFDDRDHDAVFSAGDVGLAGVEIRENATGTYAITRGDGSFEIAVPGGTSAFLIEKNPSGYISLSPDSLGPFLVSAGDTVQVEFADLKGLSLSSGSVLNGLAGGYVDFPHVVVVGTAGHVDLTAVAEAGIETMFLFDENGNGIFDGNDRVLQPSDGDLDPSTGDDKLYFLFRVFIPAAYQVGKTVHVSVEAAQSISGTPLVSRETADDAVVVIGSASGRLTLQKQVDKPTAAPGEVITYTIQLFNAGIDSVQNVVLYDPISPYIDLLPDAFGPGMDVEWQREGIGSQYLTFDPSDADECEFRAAEYLLQMLFSKNSPVFMLPGERSIIVYKAMVK
ncbi:MAG: DUF11 domain-containing protein [Candidatus Latescibacteria bacterium]|nr:DUF11 domain-containing protein [Candidatus Latescibacterota bacterium]NIM64529.1 DUF11 domain-containing protein [Candidatus Latescibacterota bacterium]NIO00682.1 DUF11 domain-containing protein [Candidatus Latescibacterota bacterium]NIO27085.1 DUF11 domain-containing protein [Candidatus Latescibacterota bacterium]NIO54609.1 DUF11 domain-containing protein [Candidatus Latescibacterota bacterium]